MGIMGIFHIMGNAGFISSTVPQRGKAPLVSGFSFEG